MPLRYAFILRVLFACALSASLWIASDAASNAQSSLRPETQTKLATKIHLSLGATTLPIALKALSAQTNLTIEAIAYLQERSLLIEVDGLSARAALDGIAEMNDWTWHETTPGLILMSRTLPRYPQSLPERR